jgi:hypothetical protein
MDQITLSPFVLYKSLSIFYIGHGESCLTAVSQVRPVFLLDIEYLDAAYEFTPPIFKGP